MLNVEVPLFRVRRGLQVAFHSQADEVPAPTEKPNPGALSLALGHRLVRAVEAGEADDFTDLARRLKVSQPRVSMLVALTFLAPDIQEEILRGGPEVAHLTIHHLLMVARMPAWVEQRRFWAGLRRAAPMERNAR